MEESKVKTAGQIEYFIDRNRKICWESEYENGEFCIGENKVILFVANFQSQITKLEDENQKLKTVLLSIRDRCAKSRTIYNIITKALENEI